jgi:DNA-binding transcriptional ArsR family regulator
VLSAEKHWDSLWSLLGHETRRLIVRFVARQTEPVSPADVAAALKREGRRIPLSDISYHFRLLAKAGALDLDNEVPVGGSLKHLYSLNAQFAAKPLVVALVAGTL